MKYEKNSLLKWYVLHDPHRVREAIAAGADVNARDGDKWISLHYCNDVESIRLLVEAGADVNAKDKKGCTPLYCATRPAVAVALLEAGVDWTIRDKDGVTAAQYLLASGFEPAVEAIEQWISHKRAQVINEQLETSEAQRGPGL